MFLVALGTVYDVTYSRIKSNFSKGFSNNFWVFLWNVRFFSEEKSEIFTSFSAISNAKVLFSCNVSTSPDVISCFYGIRAIAALGIILCHTHFCGTFLNWAKHKEVTICSFILSLKLYGLVKYKLNFLKFHTAVFNISFGGGAFAVESFFLLSGILGTFTILNQRSKMLVYFYFIWVKETIIVDFSSENEKSNCFYRYTFTGTCVWCRCSLLS